MTHVPQRKEYHPPRLTVYGDVREITLAATLTNQKNDSSQGQQNLKT